MPLVMVWSLANKLRNLLGRQLMATCFTNSSYCLASQVKLYMAKKIYTENGGWFLEAYSVMTNFSAKATNSIAKVMNSFANGTNSWPISAMTSQLTNQSACVGVKETSTRNVENWCCTQRLGHGTIR